ncbi:MAG TPA: transcription antitermination factor NusB, partial [Acidimicrobiales bacterium]|nr:transcription antitermination factor NusB [Acidimicrobiales bacterium]
ARSVALEALVAVDGGARANVVVPQLLDRGELDARDRSLVTELVYGTCRMRRACDWLVDKYVTTRTDPAVRAALRLGAYQLAYLRIPSHAAVSATVGEVSGPGRAVVNAVLRRLAAQLDSGPPRWPDPATELSYPDWLVTRLAADLGPEPARAALETMNRPAEATERPDGYIQDLASQLVAAHVGAAPGQRILDLCAAPGGKATALAGAGSALVVAADNDPRRARVIATNADRLEQANVATVVADGREPAWRPASFDRVLVDAPCSGLGVLRRRPDARWRVQPGDVPRLAELQRRLLDAAVPLVRPGGTLVYSVCTLTLAETAAVDRWLAAAYPELQALPPPAAPFRPAGRGGLLLPQAAGTDGMFALALRVPAR